MLDLKKVEKLGDLFQNEKEFNHIIKSILEDLKILIGSNPKYKKIDFVFNNVEKADIFDLFSIGVKRKIGKDKISIFFDSNYKKYHPFIVLRELYNLFVPKEIRKSESVQLIINQIIMTQLSSFKHLNEWKRVIRGNLKQSDAITTGYNDLIGYDRLEKFFNIAQQDSSKNLVKLFFNYLHKSKSLFKKDRIYLIALFLDEFKNFSSDSINSEDLVDTINCIIDIFYNVQQFESILKYKDLFQEYKDKRLLTTNLSLRRFEKNLNWIKSNSMIAPSYQLQYKSINLQVILIFISFNSVLSKDKILEALKGFPFFITPKYFYNGFGLDLCGYVVLPKYYIRDLLDLVKKLEDYNYITDFRYFEILNQKHCVNLNYFREFAQNQRIMEIKSQHYEIDYEIQFESDYGGNLTERKLELLDFLILDRIRSFSYFSFGFDKRAKTLGTLKSDLTNEIITQRAIIKELKDTLQKFYESTDLKNHLIKLLEENRKTGFFHIKKIIENYNYAINIVEVFITNNPEISSISKLNEVLTNKNYYFTLNDRVVLKLKYIEREIIQNLFLQLFFSSKTQYYQLKSGFANFNELFNSFYNLKIYNLNTIKSVILNEEIINNLFDVKEKRLKEAYEKFKSYKISGKLINEKIRKYLSYTPPLIKPLVINTIITDQYVHSFLEIILLDSKENRKKLDTLKVYFPRFIIFEICNLSNDQKYVMAEISVPYLSSREKELFMSFFLANFKENIILARFYVWTGMVSAFSSKSFYDFENERFFYTPDLFKQYFLNVRKAFGEIKKSSCRNTLQNEEYLVSEVKSFSELTRLINSNNLKKWEKIDLKSLESLTQFHIDIIKTLQDDSIYKSIKSRAFFSNHVKHVYFFPIYYRFKLSQNYLYFKKLNLNLDRLKEILGISIQKLKFSSSIERDPSFLISYIQALEPTNSVYQNLTDMGDLHEFCYFRVKNVCILFNFQSNLTEEGWNYNKDFFNVHINDVLSTQDKFKGMVKDHILYDEDCPSFYDSRSKEYNNLLKIYNWDPIDIKSYLLTKKVKTIEVIRDLLSKNLIVPNLSVKNVGFRDTIYFIVPNIKKNDLLKLKKIFSFFNYGFIFEIEGFYRISGQDEIIQFKDGLFIKLKLPKCKISEFTQLIDLLFEYLNINAYVTLINLINGSHKIKKMKTTT